MFPPEITITAGKVLEACRDRGLRLATAESCTGGLIAGALTAIAGSSDVVERGFVTYTNAAKTDVLGVPVSLFDSVGAVSEEVARAMAEGALARCPAAITVSATGIAGPGGSTEFKPVGRVHIACARTGRETLHQCHDFPGDRDSVRMATVGAALTLVLQQVEQG